MTVEVGKVLYFPIFQRRNMRPLLSLDELVPEFRNSWLAWKFDLFFSTFPLFFLFSSFLPKLVSSRMNWKQIHPRTSLFIRFSIRTARVSFRSQLLEQNTKIQRSWLLKREFHRSVLYRRYAVCTYVRTSWRNWINRSLYRKDRV